MWFDGPIENAVAKAKSEKQLLVIFVCGDDDTSRRVSAYWDDDSVKKLVTENSCVALKLAEGSEPAKMFAQIYPVVSIPICFFITPEGGVPMEVVANFENLESFKERFSKVIETFRESAKPVTVSESHSTPTLPERASSSSAAKKTAASMKSRRDTIRSHSVPPRHRVVEDFVPSGIYALGFKEQTDVDGFIVTVDLKDFTAEEIELVKIETCLYVECSKVDKSGFILKSVTGRLRIPQFMNIYARLGVDGILVIQGSVNELENMPGTIIPIRDSTPASFHFSSTRKQNLRLRQSGQELKKAKQKEEQRKRFSLLQFRLPDGSSLRHQFDGTALLREAHEWFARESNSPASSFLLVQMYPRREFTPEDANRSLVELGLTPSAVLMVLPNETFLGWLLSTIFYTVTAPVRFVYRLLYGFLFGTGASARPVTGGQSNNRNSPAAPDQQRPGTSGAGAGNSGGSSAV